MIVIGDKEADGGNLQIRVSGEANQLEMSRNDFLEKILEEIKNRII